MSTHVALLRAVNVGGTGKLPMAELRGFCEEAGFEDVQTYIASGNVVFRSADSPDRVRSILERRLEDYAGKKVQVFVRSAREIADLVKANPFPGEPGNRVAVIFLLRKPPGDLESRAKGLVGERFRAGAQEIFVHYPEGLGQSKLSFEGLGATTTRNMNTVRKLAEIAA